jgi:tyrosine-protein phosphatase SIW14
MKNMENYSTPSRLSLFLVIFCLLTVLPSFAYATEQSASSLSSENSPFADSPGRTSRELSLPAGARLSEHLLGLRGLKNVGRIDADVYRGAQPAQEGYATLKEMGIRTVINLRTSESERSKVEATGMRSVEIPLSMLSNGDKDKVDKVVAVMADPSNRPVFVHCRLGEDRTGIVVAAYRMKIQGWPLSLAEAEMDSFGFNNVWINLRKFLHRYATGLVRAKQER